MTCTYMYTFIALIYTHVHTFTQTYKTKKIVLLIEWCMLVILALRRLRQNEGWEFKGSLDYIVRLYISQSISRKDKTFEYIPLRIQWKCIEIRCFAKMNFLSNLRLLFIFSSYKILGSVFTLAMITGTIVCMPQRICYFESLQNNAITPAIMTTPHFIKAFSHSLFIFAMLKAIKTLGL